MKREPKSQIREISCRMKPFCGWKQDILLIYKKYQEKIKSFLTLVPLPLNWRNIFFSLSPRYSLTMYTLGNSYDFVNKLSNYTITQNHSMVSLDMKFLFTNILIQGALSCFKIRLQEFHYSQMEITEVINLTSICLLQNAFIFNNNFYRMSDGLSTGSPPHQMSNDIYMHYFEVNITDFPDFCKTEPKAHHQLQSLRIFLMVIDFVFFLCIKK